MESKNFNEQTPLKKVSDLFSFLSETMGGGEVRDRIGIVRSEWHRILNGKDLPINRFEEILNQVGVNTLTAMNYTIDHRLAEQFLRGGHDQVPSEYLKGAYSTRRIGRIIIDILKDQFGDSFVRKILLSLQIGPTFFSKEMDSLAVNTEIYGRLYALLTRNFGFSEDDLYWIGQKTAFYNESTPFAKKFSKLSLTSNYAYFLEEVAKDIEQSYDYELVALSADKVLIKKKLNQKIQDETGKKIYGNRQTCAYSLGFATTLGHFSCGAFPQAKMIKSLYDTGDCSIYEINLKKFTPPRLFYDSVYSH